MQASSDITFEAKSLIKLAMPIIMALTLTCLMSVIDTVMAGQVSAQDLAAVSIGAALWNLLFLTMTAILMALTPQIAKFNGQQKFDVILDWLSGSRWFALGLSALFLILGKLGIDLIHLLNAHPTTSKLAANYLGFILIGLPASALFQVHKSLSEGNGITRHVLIITTGAVLLNIPLNYLFIHGWSLSNGIELIPALGGAGCGLASAIIFWISLLGLIVIQKKDKQLIEKVGFQKTDNTTKQLSFSWKIPDNQKQVSLQLIKIGVPIGLAILAEASVFTYIPLVIAHLGEVQVASHQIALNVCSVMFMVPLGMSQAITVRTGYQLGRKDFNLAKIVSRTGIGLAFLFGIFSLTLIMLNSENIPVLYTDDENVLVLASSLLILAALFQLFDTVQITAAGALRGYQLTTIPMILTILAFWAIAIPVGYILGLESEVRSALENHLTLPDPMGVKGFWYALIAGLSANGLLQLSYLFYVQKYKFNAEPKPV